MLYDQPSSRIAGDNVLNKRYDRTTDRNQGLNQLEALKTEKKNETKWISTRRSRAYYVLDKKEYSPKDEQNPKNESNPKVNPPKN